MRDPSVQCPETPEKGWFPSKKFYMLTVPVRRQLCQPGRLPRTASVYRKELTDAFDSRPASTGL